MFCRAAKQQGGPALERLNDETCTIELKRTGLSGVFPIEIKLSTTLNCAELINSKHNECLELKSLRVNTVGVFAVPRLFGRKTILQ